jgi:hypothetical protein
MENIFDKKQVLVTTITGEPFQPARVYYQVFNQKTVISAFKKLKCINYDPSRDRWVWEYEAEAKKIRFENSYHKIAKHLRPVVIGYFRFRGDQEMVLELNSFDRVLKAIVFFDHRINRHAAKVTKVRVVNKLMSAPDDPETLEAPTDFDAFFERDDIYIPDPQKMEVELNNLVNQYEDEEEKMKAISDFLDLKAKTSLPEIEEIPIHFYEDGIEPLIMALNLRNIEAYQHWLGNKNFRQFDIIEQMLAEIDEEYEEYEDDYEE